jgi:hypothetical protein
MLSSGAKTKTSHKTIRITEIKASTKSPEVIIIIGIEQTDLFSSPQSILQGFSPESQSNSFANDDPLDSSEQSPLQALNNSPEPRDETSELILSTLELERLSKELKCVQDISPSKGKTNEKIEIQGSNFTETDILMFEHQSVVNILNCFTNQSYSHTNLSMKER